MNSKVESRELIKVLCTHSIKLSSLHCLRTSKRSSMGGRWSKCIVLPTVLRSKKKERKKRGREKRKKMNDDEKLLGPVCFPTIILYSIIPTMCNLITRTSVLPWDQPLTFAYVHHPKCVFHSLPLHKEIIFQWSF